MLATRCVSSAATAALSSASSFALAAAILAAESASAADLALPISLAAASRAARMIASASFCGGRQRALGGAEGAAWESRGQGCTGQEKRLDCAARDAPCT
jgi:hypothetical protein